ncbi:endopeptidase inhibitor activity protein [Homalodisca vitripennis]|nr:endopeptidase inhibitor activity protein [Homalodisca vitripennis]
MEHKEAAAKRKKTYDLELKKLRGKEQKEEKGSKILKSCLDSSPGVVTTQDASPEHKSQHRLQWDTNKNVDVGSFIGIMYGHLKQWDRKAIVRGRKGEGKPFLALSFGPRSYCNDLRKYLEEFTTTFMYALLLSEKSAEQLEIQSYILMNMAVQYCHYKTQQIIMSSKIEQTTQLPSVKVATEEKYLGVIIGREVRWTSHIDNLCINLSILTIVALYILQAVAFVYKGVLPEVELSITITLVEVHSLLTGSQELVCVSLHNNTGRVYISLSLLATSDNHVLASTSLTIASAGCVELTVPDTEERLARLEARLQSPDPQLTSNAQVEVRVQRNPLLVLVSTDKPLYKAGQQVNFRVLSLNHKLKPHSKQIPRIWIETPSGVQVQQWREVKVNQLGLIQQQFTLDKEPLLGQWKIKVQHTSSKITETRFFVKEYIPAKFEVTVDAPTEIFLDSENVSWHICGKYSYGQVVQGDAHVEIKLQGSRSVDQPSINNAVKLNPYSGCVVLTVEAAELGLSDPLVQPSAVQVVATVTEQGSGISHTSSVLSPIHIQRFSIHFLCSRYYKPGLPYTGNRILSKRISCTTQSKALDKLRTQQLRPATFPGPLPLYTQKLQ